MQQGNYTNITWNGTNFFTGYVQDGNIFTSMGEQVGVNLAKYQEIEQALTKCKNRLIELGEIKIPKTPEQIIEEQQSLIEKQTQAINQLLERINNEQEPSTESSKLPTSRDEGQCEASIKSSSGTSGSEQSELPTRPVKRDTKIRNTK